MSIRDFLGLEKGKFPSRHFFPILACLYVLLERQESKGGRAFPMLPKSHFCSANVWEEQLSSSPSFGKFLSPFLQPPKANAKATFRDLSASPPPLRRRGEMHCVHIGVTRAFPREGRGGLNLSGILHF